MAWTRLGWVLAVLLAPSGVWADQTDPRLDGLFAPLRTADHATAAPIEAEIWQIWLRSGRDDVDALVAQGLDDMTQGDQTAALGVFDRVVRLAPDYAEGWNKRATVLFLLGRYALSMQDIARVLALEPRHFGALSGLGLCNLALGRDEAALAAFQRAAAIDPSLPGVRDNIQALRLRIEKQRI